MGVAGGLLGAPCSLPNDCGQKDSLLAMGLPCTVDAHPSSAPCAPWCNLPKEVTPGLLCCSLDQDVQQLSAASWLGTHRSSSAASGGKKLEELYDMDRNAKPIGKGGFGMVYMARVRADPCTRVAIKMMDKVRLRQLKAPADMVVNEVQMMRECIGRDGFVQLFDFIETPGKFCLVLEFCGSGTLQDAVMCTEGFLGEVQVRFLMQQILDAIAFLHGRNICHRDVKPQNFMVYSGPMSSPALVHGPPTVPLQASRAASVDGGILAREFVRPFQVPLEPPRAMSTDNGLVRLCAYPQQPPPHGSFGADARAPSAGLRPQTMLRVKLGDFGTSLRIQTGKLVRCKIGTPAFMAPEMHLLPARSPGYDNKVDIWAAGVVMVFLLANEYPFIDGTGRLLRHKLIVGDVPIWETGTFQDVFLGFQEAVGMGTRKKRPSKLARDLAFHLLTPGRQNRATAGSALRHQWFKLPVPEGGNDHEVIVDAKLLDWKDFEDGLGVVGRDLQWAMDMMTGSLGTTVDDPLKTCVVCYSAAGGVGYICPQCHHAVCAQCLEQLPKATCPYCRHEALDMPFSRRLVDQILQAQTHQRPPTSSDVPSRMHAKQSPSGAEKPRPYGPDNKKGVVKV